MVILLCFAFGCQQGEEVAEEPAVDIEAERSAVQDALTYWWEMSAAKNVAGMASVQAEDCLVPGYSKYDDKAFFKEYWSKQFSEGMELSGQTDKVIVAESGDFAFSCGTYERKRIVEGETRVSKMTHLQVLKKQADGSWKIVIMK